MQPAVCCVAEGNICELFTVWNTQQRKIWKGCELAVCLESDRASLREFALGIEALERFTRHEPLRRVHECVFGILALDEPVDPRL